MTMLGFLVFPLVWSVQEAFVTAELSSAFPEASGGVAWVEEAFGEFAGWLAGISWCAAGATDNAIYPALIIDYTLQLMGWQLHGWPRFIIQSAICIVLIYLNYRGLHVVGDISMGVSLVSLAPFVMFCILAIPQIQPSRWFALPESPVIYSTDDNPAGGVLPYAVFSNVIWRTYLNNLFWNFNYFDNAASFADDVRDPGKTYPRAMAIGLLIVVSVYIFPVAAAIGVSDEPQHAWVNGYLVTVIANSTGQWVGAWAVFGIAVCNISLFQAQLSATAYKLMGMAERGYLPGKLMERNSFGTPTYTLLIGGVIAIVLNMLHMDTLVEALNFNYAM